MNDVASDYKIALGNTVRELRLKAGFSQETFAERIGLHRTYIGAIERGERNVALENIIKIACAFQLEPSELLALSERNDSRNESMDCK